MVKAFRQPLDFYETPTRQNTGSLAKCAVIPLLQRLDRFEAWVDLGCGRGAIGVALKAYTGGCRGIGVEYSIPRAALALKTEAYLEVIVGDVSDPEVQEKIRAAVRRWFGRASPDLVIDNPPFSTWEAFEAAADKLEPVQQAHLLPWSAFEADRGSRKGKIAGRAKRLRDPTAGRYDLAIRPAFIRAFQEEDGSIVYEASGTDAAAYAWRVKGIRHAGAWAFLEPPKVGGGA